MDSNSSRLARLHERVLVAASRPRATIERPRMVRTGSNRWVDAVLIDPSEMLTFNDGITLKKESRVIGHIAVTIGGEKKTWSKVGLDKSILFVVTPDIEIEYIPTTFPGKMDLDACYQLNWLSQRRLFTPTHKSEDTK